MSINEDRDELTTVRVGESYHAQDAAKLHDLAISNQQLQNDAQRFNAEQRAAAPTPGHLLQTFVAGNTSSLTVRGGEMTFSNGGQASARTNAPLPEGRVIVNGMETTVEAARAAGFDVDTPQQQQPPSQQRPQQQFTRAAPEQAPQPQAVPSETTAAEASAIQLAHAATIRAEQVLGPVTVQSMTEDFVATGVMPALPESIHPDMVASAIAGFEAQANAVLRSTGASVHALNQFLNENELREARLATYKGNDTKLRELGSKANDRLAKLPNDPTHFQQLTSGPGWEGVQITRNGGRFYVKAPEWAEPIEWGRAVRSGKISL